jgi:hypothetical protein
MPNAAKHHRILLTPLIATRITNISMTKKYTPARILQEWIFAATTAEQKVLVSRAGISRAYLYQLGSGFRHLTAEIAARLEKSSKDLSKASKGRLPRLRREELSPVCGNCPYSPGCKKK